MVRIRSFPFGARPIFRGEKAVSFRETSPLGYLWMEPHEIIPPHPQPTSPSHIYSPLALGFSRSDFNFVHLWADLDVEIQKGLLTTPPKKKLGSKRKPGKSFMIPIRFCDVSGIPWTHHKTFGGAKHHFQGKKGDLPISHSHTIHVWYIYLHLVNFYDKCRFIYTIHSWILWD